MAYYPVCDGGADPIMIDVLGIKREQADGVLDPDVFLASYPFWSPTGVSRGFEAIGARSSDTHMKEPPNQPAVGTKRKKGSSITPPPGEKAHKFSQTEKSRAR